jgi:2-dehydro-3-deoxyphosphogluconate aldolase/(4S)-4-hydroxy-2-oxoglutarate aldolase
MPPEGCHDKLPGMIYSRIEVILSILERGMIPLFYHGDIEKAKLVLEACYKGGARHLEFTNRGENALKVFTALAAFANEKLPGMILGVGSVTDAAQATVFMMAGANFIVTPVLRKDIARVCNRRKVLWIPGCGSLQEVAKAEELGAEFIKLFPGDVYGPKFVKAISGPQPWTRIMPTGGVQPTRESLTSWFDAGVSCVGMGSSLISKEVLEKEQFSDLEHLIRTTLLTIEEIRT